jgi:hypothetical protein
MLVDSQPGTLAALLLLMGEGQAGRAEIKCC